MVIPKLIGATELKVDPVVEKMGLVFMLFGLFAIVVLLILIFTSNRTDAKKEIKEARKLIKFDPVRSVITRGDLRLEIPDQKMEHYICKAVFSNPMEYHNDIDIKNSSDSEGYYSERAVYQGVGRINKKARESLLLDEDLIKRSKERTILNEDFEY